jgi:hypothetical protein
MLQESVRPMSRTGFSCPPEVIDVAAVETTPTPLLQLRCRTADSGEKNFFVSFYHMLPTRCCQHLSASVSFDDQDRSQLLLHRKARRSRGMSAIGRFCWKTLSSIPARNIDSLASVVRAIEIQNDRGIGSNIALPNHLAEFFNRIGHELKWPPVCVMSAFPWKWTSLAAQTT